MVKILTILTFQVNQVAHHFVGGGDDLGVGLEAALNSDHPYKLLGQVHIGLFKGICEQFTDPGADRTDNREARFIGCGPHVAAIFNQSARGPASGKDAAAACYFLRARG